MDCVSCWAHQCLEPLIGTADESHGPLTTIHSFPRLDSSSYCPFHSPFTSTSIIHPPPSLSFALPPRLIHSSLCHTLPRAPFSTATATDTLPPSFKDAAGERTLDKNDGSPSIHHHPSISSRLFLWRCGGRLAPRPPTYLIIDTIH